MTSKQRWLTFLLSGLAVLGLFVYVQVDIVTQAVHLNLRTAGQSVYEAHQKTGRWPTKLDDLQGTAILHMPYRREQIEAGRLVVVWPQGFQPDPAANGDKILAYDNGTVLSWCGWIWVCRGDLRLECLSSAELKQRLQAAGE